MRETASVIAVVAEREVESTRTTSRLNFRSAVDVRLVRRGSRLRKNCAEHREPLLVLNVSTCMCPAGADEAPGSCHV